LTVGWLLLSSKTISKETFLPSLRAKLQLPPQVTVGIQFRPILLPNGKRPPYDKDDPAPIALHLEIDELYFGRYKKAIAKIFWSGSRASINGLTLRLVPCFLAKGNHMVFDADTTAQLVELAQRQKQFLSTQLIELRMKFFALLDTSLSPTDSTTLRRHIMSRAPTGTLTKQIFHNIDLAWSQPNMCICTTVKSYQNMADEAINNIIPKTMVHGLGPVDV
jgi:hypothetical protein